MDSLQSLPSIGEGSQKKGENVIWTFEMDKTLVFGLLNQIAQGQKIPNGFKDLAYHAAAKEVNSKCLVPVPIDKKLTINRIKTMKRDYKALHILLKKSGIGWNNITKRIEVIDAE